jgi:hypothetical protein
MQMDATVRRAVYDIADRRTAQHRAAVYVYVFAWEHDEPDGHIIQFGHAAGNAAGAAEPGGRAISARRAPLLG